MTRVLVAEDEEADRHLLATVLEEAGYEVVATSDGDSALEAYFTERFAAVVTDVVMPGSDGVQLIHRLLAVDPRARIIAVSGKGQTGLHFAAVAGALQTLQKPVDPDALRGAVEAAVGAAG